MVNCLGYNLRSGSRIDYRFHHRDKSAMSHKHKREDDAVLWMVVIVIICGLLIVGHYIDVRLDNLECQIDPVCMEALDAPSP